MLDYINDSIQQFLALGTGEVFEVIFQTVLGLIAIGIIIKIFSYIIGLLLGTYASARGGRKAFKR